MGLLRLVLAYVVVLAHMGSRYVPMDPGLAVQMFFVVSGFYMALVLETKYAASQSTFYLNRLLRIFPAYWVVLSLSFASLMCLGINEYASKTQFVDAMSNTAVAIPVALANAFIVGQDILFWFDIDDGGFVADVTYSTKAGNVKALSLLLVAPAWSLALELMFYALAPWLSRRTTFFLASVIIFSGAIRFVGEYFGISYNLWPRRFFPAELGLFVVGMLAYRLRWIVDRLPSWYGFLVLLGVIALIATHKLLPGGLNWWRGTTLAILAFALPLVFRAFKAIKWDRIVGDLSYPVYICHVLVIALAQAYLPQNELLVMVLVLLTSSALLIAVDMPIDRRRQALARRQW